MYVPVTPPPLSPEAEDLGQLIAETVRAYREEHPHVGRTDVGQAFHAARAAINRELGTCRTATAPRVMAALLGVMACLGGVVFFLGQSGGISLSQPAMPWIVVAATGAVAIGTVFALIARR